MKFPFEMPYLSAFELFVGFSRQDISYLERNVLHVVKESLQSYLNEVKAAETEQDGLSQISE